MTKTVNVLLPNVALQFRAEALLVAIIIFVIADLIRVPYRLSMSLVGLLAGLSVATGVLANGVYVAEVVAMWVAAPLIAIAFRFLPYSNHQQELAEKYLASTADLQGFAYCFGVFYLVCSWVQIP